ncbi:D-amino-acid transaminase [Bacillus xiapuensis]|uniref:D-amino-acid transaminase n=1 Tax=Bacillus xiapuensis TaxID=2014075 RepID=UPI000C23B6E6|nr:D-amino-acid transaminase [Bacillus xiapuensis]
MELAYFNGRMVGIDEAVVPIDERGHQFGDGVYEVIRFYRSKPFRMEEHIKRLYNSAEAIKLEIGCRPAELKEKMLELAAKSGLEDADLYMQATRGMAPRSHIFPSCPASISMTIKPARHVPEEARKRGAKVLLVEDERWKNCYIKSLNLLPNVLAKQEAAEHDCDEAILVRDGFITEGASSNFFIVKDGCVRTAPLTRQILPGITRMAVQSIADELKIPFIEQAFTAEDLYGAQEAFLTSTSSEIMPVTIADEQPIGGGKPGEITLKLFQHFQTKL